MRSSSIVAGLLSVATLSEARCWQHVGKKEPQYLRDRNTLMSDFLATREVPAPKFATDKTAKFSVNGTGIPDVEFDVGESYSGYLPISNDTDAGDDLFFWFFPQSSSTSEKEVLIWLNGGPGCSSFEGLIQENGPFQWQYGTYKPVPNPWAWNRLINMVWVEQPIGTGFSRGTVTAKGEEDVAQQFLGFWKNFVDTFEMQGYKVFIAGESYAGMYCPYIASAMLDAADPDYYNMSGMLIYDPTIGQGVVQDAVTTVPFVDYHSNLMPFNDSFSDYIHDQHQKCGFADYMATYLEYPPPGPQPSDYTVSDECAGIWELVLDNALSINPCFDVYQVATTCPLLWDVLGFPGSIEYSPEGSGPVYFNREDVKRAIHANVSTEWAECAASSVFAGDGGDSSDPSSWRAIPHVLEATNNVIIAHGVMDMILLPNGTLLSIQNMTWGGKLGFQSPPVEPFYVPFHTLSTSTEIYAETNTSQLSTIAGAGVFGSAHTERGLTFVGVNVAGHMVPQYAPSAAFRHLEFLLGRVDSLSSTEPFTIDKSYPQPPADSLGKATGPSTSGLPPNGTSTENAVSGGSDVPGGSRASSLIASPGILGVVGGAAVLASFVL